MKRLLLATLITLTASACTPAMQDAWRAMSPAERDAYVAMDRADDRSIALHEDIDAAELADLALAIRRER